MGKFVRVVSLVMVGAGYNISCVSLQSSRNVEVFDLAATTLTVPSQSHSYAVVTFTPQAMQQYSAVFEATLEGPSRYMCPADNVVLMSVCPFVIYHH